MKSYFSAFDADIFAGGALALPDFLYKEKTAGYGPAVLHNIGFSAKAILT
ncbi:MAG: hypothetical protein ACLUFI_01445 [Oscillospiraceae bacterium]